MVGYFDEVRLAVLNNFINKLHFSLVSSIGYKKSSLYKDLSYR